MIALRTGMLVDRKTGEKTYVAAPLCAHTNYLRAFHENRVQYPQGKEWNTMSKSTVRTVRMTGMHNTQECRRLQRSSRGTS